MSRRSLQPMLMHKERQGHVRRHPNCWELDTGQKTASFGTAFPLLGRGWEALVATTGHGQGDPPKPAPCVRASWAQGKGWSWLGQGWDEPPAHSNQRMFLWEANQWQPTSKIKWEGSKPCRSEEVVCGSGTSGHSGTGTGWEPKYRQPCCPFPEKQVFFKTQKF